ncbi:MAG: DUF4147 domain-containing protein [Candidatus Colwellbacteria bacterium]|nr:DUF4147 domain-containing protein [Candidatus Colwellbacteria bacterium]
MPGKIQNFKQLATTELRQALLEIIEAGLEAIDTKDVVRSEISLNGDELKIADHRYSLEKIRNLYVFGAGKCVLEAAEVLEEILGDRLTGGFIIDVRVPARHSLRKIKCIEGTHPLPSAVNVKASKRMLKELKGLGEEDFVLFVISGGGSALLCLPQNGKDYRKEISIQKALAERGAEIEELNTVRKHLSLVRGGYLAEYVHPARAVSVIFSDVPGNELDFVASGPTVKDETTVADAGDVVRKYGIEEYIHPDASQFIETPKENKYFMNVDNIMLISNERALKAMVKKARDLGYKPTVVTDNLTGEARNVALKIVQELHSCASKTVLLYGGETTVTILTKGEGGRNRELVLSALQAVKRDEGLASVASDGRDNGQSAGAIADSETLQHAAAHQLDIERHLNGNQSAKFFKKTGDDIMTGDTGSNISDLVIAVKN